MTPNYDRQLSTHHRAELLQSFETEEYDLLVIGGGITGAGIALDAASRGLKVALVEKKDFGWGTSSRSTKLIHGGLRYLKQLEIKLVREVGQERATLHKNAPHLVIPENMLLPLVEGGSLGKYSSSLGLYVYDWLAGVKRDERRRMLSKDETTAMEPLLRDDILVGGGLYKEYRTDDARLVAEVMKSATWYGADCLNYVEVTGFEYQDGKVNKTLLKDNLSGKELTIKSKKIINAAGPWVDAVRKLDGEQLKGKRLHLTKGVHLVVDREKFPLKQAVYFDVHDGRMMFCIPRGKVTYIGTTDTNYQKDIDDPQTSKADLDYLLKAVSYMFPDVQLNQEDVTSSWSGLRPLIHEEGKDPSELSRKDEIFFGKSGIVSIAGGKLTGFRMMAKRVVDIITKQLEKEEDLDIPDSKTEDIVLSGGNFTETLPELKERLFGEARQIEASSATINDLVNKYGKNAETIIEYAYELHKTFTDPHERLLAAEVKYTIEHEMVASLPDFLIRRTGRLYFDRPNIEQDLPILDKLFTHFLPNLAAKQAELKKEFEEEYQEVITFE